MSIRIRKNDSSVFDRLQQAWGSTELLRFDPRGSDLLNKPVLTELLVRDLLLELSIRLFDDHPADRDGNDDCERDPKSKIHDSTDTSKNGRELFPPYNSHSACVSR